MQCPDCGVTVPDGADRCPSCGQTEHMPHALTPPKEDSGADTPSTDVDRLSRRLQEALGAQYEVVRAIGQGGFAVVYLVRDQTLKRSLAVKVISPDLILSKTVVERFRREAETVAQLSHANIVPVHFVGHQDDLFYLAMAFVDGESLADKLEREGRLSIEESTVIFREIASALDLAHRRGVVHRDIKPHNVLLEGESGRALLTDFGIARTAEGGQLTATGMVVGTPAYMAPEQVTGETIDHRSDLYALGCVAFEMLAGRPPFEGATPQAMLYRRVSESPPAVETLRADTPPDLAELVNHCLAPEPGDRPTSAGEIARALGATTPVTGTRSSIERINVDRSKRSRVPLVTAVAGGVLVAGTAAVLLLGTSGTDSEPAVSSNAAVPDGMVLVPGGSYTLGADDGHRWSRPAFTVTVDSFAIDRTEVTVREYADFVRSTGRPAPWSEVADSTVPVTGVTWTEARAYCDWREEGGRLPSEFEWEVAARAGDERRYPWGNDPPGQRAVIGERRNRPAPVGTRPGGATPQGAYDMIGNVWEWTASPMEPYPGGERPPRSEDTYVIRGGAFNTPDSLATALYRGYMPPEVERRFLRALGFRCAVGMKSTSGK